MKSERINGKEYLFVEIPKVEGCELRGMHSHRDYELLSFYGEADAIELPKNQRHSIVGKASELTEEQCWMLASTSPEKLMDYIGMKPEATLILQKQ